MIGKRRNNLLRERLKGIFTMSLVSTSPSVYDPIMFLTGDQTKCKRKKKNSGAFSMNRLQNYPSSYSLKHGSKLTSGW